MTNYRSDELMALIVQLMTVKRQVSQINKVWLEKTHLTSLDLEILLAIKQAGTMTNAELAAACSVVRPLTSRQTWGLITRGFLKSENDPDGRRKNQLSLTDAGRQKLAVIRTQLDHNLKTSVQRKELVRLAAAIDKLRHDLGAVAK
ncbi:hypothetical protein N692_02460 [Lactiplantibacillus plantarum EGD-AQ4]|nr:hypothetical protein N692_02460 [Lactiplantibacillus plantarum EGD-AQ4]